MSLRLLQQFENLMSSYPSLEKNLGVTDAILSIRGDIDELLKNTGELLSETFNRAETETDTFYQLNMKSRSLAEENAKDLFHNLLPIILDAADWKNINLPLMSQNFGQQNL